MKNCNKNDMFLLSVFCAITPSRCVRLHNALCNGCASDFCVFVLHTVIKMIRCRKVDTHVLNVSKGVRMLLQTQCKFVVKKNTYFCAHFTPFFRPCSLPVSHLKRGNLHLATDGLLCSVFRLFCVFFVVFWPRDSAILVHSSHKWFGFVDSNELDNVTVYVYSP